ncbi:uncharacterized protein LOC106061087 isoform X1 [Biomphalaria glabrata]|uniref:Uncharacterized protein LOC106061087 isoform X1 n=2 Tax=Biomphalaria glabrata TaxID=6526 RepID=A0A9W2ZA78_BIOGL|nr:uncharacterized protein LOC106061087 isoform X1 [Biomphalaria glabrata]
MSQELESSIDTGQDTVTCSDDQSMVESKKVMLTNKRWDSMDSLLAQIKEKETLQDNIKNLQCPNITKELKALKAEKNATIEKRKQIDTELDKWNKDLPEKMRQLSQLESSLIYKNEEKINTAIQKLDWTLQHQHFKLTEERKIVTEIDRLRRSKRTLAQYFTLKQEISGIRDKQRRMREERDTYYQAVRKMKAREDHLKEKLYSLKSQLDSLKREIDSLHDHKRQLRKQKEVFHGVRERQKRDSWKRRDEGRKSYIADSQREDEESEVPYEKLIQLCNTLYNHLQRFNNLSAPEPSVESLSPSSSLEVEEDVDEGHHILRKKSSDAESAELTGGAKKSMKRNKKPRKQSSFKKMTHSSQVLEQFLALGLSAPTSVAEIPEVLEKLVQKKVDLEKEVASDAGFSATESYICEMSRQASNTESHEDYVDTHAAENVIAELMSVTGSTDASEGAVGGCERASESSEVMSPNSDSTLEGDSGDSQNSSVVKSEDVVKDLSSKLVITEADKSNNNTVTKVQKLQEKPEMYLKPDQVSRRSSPPKNLDFRPKLRRTRNVTEELFKPATLLPSPSFGPPTVSLATPLDKVLKPKRTVARVASSPAAVHEPCPFPKSNQHGTFADHLKSPSVSPSSSFSAHNRSHPPLASRLSTPVYGSAPQWSGKRSHTVPSQTPTEPHFDISDFPPLSQAPLTKSRSNSFFSKSSNEGSAAEITTPRETFGVMATTDSFQPQSGIPPVLATNAPSPSLPVSMSMIPAEDKSLTEKWVESNAAYFHSEGSVMPVCKES